MSSYQTISISTSTLLKIVAVFLLLYFAYLILDILILLFIAVIIASLIDPLADWFARKRLHRGLAVLLVYVLVLAVFSMIIALLAPAIISQAVQLSGAFGSYWEKITSSFFTVKSLGAQFGVWEKLQSALPATLQSGVNTLQTVIGSVFGIVGGLFSLVLVLVMAFYLVVEEEDFKKALRSLVSSEHQTYLASLWTQVKERLGGWLRGVLLLGLIIGVLVYIGLKIIGVQYALLLAILAGLLEIIPYAGPVFAGLIAVLMAFLQSGNWLLPGMTAILFVVIQQVENHFLVPKVMKKAVGLNPIVSILSLLIGFRLMGIVGALLAIPVATALSVVWGAVVEWRNRK